VPERRLGFQVRVSLTANSIQSIPIKPLRISSNVLHLVGRVGRRWRVAFRNSRGVSGFPDVLCNGRDTSGVDCVRVSAFGRFSGAGMCGRPAKTDQRVA
jgi:hypothetical protein